MKKYISSLAAIAIIVIVAFACSRADSPSFGGGNSGGSESGTGGSMARFTIVGDHIYTVDNRSLKTASIIDPEHPVYLSSRQLGVDIETIFPYDGKLFIGSRSGMYIYDISDPESPLHLSTTPHFTSCDPVVASGHYAYVTLNTENTSCGRGRNELQVYDISDVKNPVMTYSYTNLNYPKGLGVDQAAEKLFVCVKGGIKIFNISDPAHPVMEKSIAGVIGYIETYDVIPMNGLLIVIGQDGLYQFDYTQENIKLVSKIDLRRTNTIY